jgi:hypothetical protein
MALTPEDKAYYRDKLGWKGFVYLFGWTVFIGAVIWPLFLYGQDWLAGQGSRWTIADILILSGSGFVLGMIISIIMYLLFRVFLAQEWLPRRR